MRAPALMVARKHYSLREIYWITVRAGQTVWAARRAHCDKQASERIMLAVTEVNGCALCSYAHTRWALDMGIPEQEVRDLLSGVASDAPGDELAGIAFGQHYADTRGRPDPVGWSEIVDTYGTDGALCVLRATRMMMWGNATGIPLSSLIARMRGRPDPRSTIAYEVLTSIGAIAVLPVALAHASALILVNRSPLPA
ncbi:MAG: carboxymuconolactone decarboxylase family protein [Actinobacteria bacterium]|nr:carboxymuconolactone decarboxylase family protein [Actinomycetota bacterium]